MSLRLQDPIPEWITHLAVVRGDRVVTGPRRGIFAVYPVNTVKTRDGDVHSHAVVPENHQGKILADMNSVNVQYQGCQVRSLTITSLPNFALNKAIDSSLPISPGKSGKEIVGISKGLTVRIMVFYLSNYALKVMTTSRLR
jgi:hypothetical protein